MKEESWVLLQPLLNAHAKEERVAETRSLQILPRAVRSWEEFLQFSYHPTAALAELNTGEKESSHATGMSPFPVVLESGS